MKVVDLRNIFTNCNDELIEISDSLIYYAEEKMEEGHPSLFLLEYNRITKRERVIANYLLPSPAYVQHYFSFPDDIVVIMESGGSDACVLRVGKHTGAEKSMAKLNFIGDFQDCRALDESHVLFYTGPNEKHRPLFREYKKLTGFCRVAYLYDLEEGKYYYARDPRVCNSDSSKFIPYSRGGSPQILVLGPHGSEEDKQNSFHNMRWLGENISDNIWTCPMIDFLVSVKAGEERIPLELILSAGTEGLVRFTGLDEENIYFRAKYFPTGDQRLCAYSMETGKKYVAARLTLGESDEPAWFSIDPEGGQAYRITECGDDDPEGGQAYRITECGDDYGVTGVMNSAIDAKYPKELGKFITCVDDRFIIARYILADETDSFEFNSIYDTQTGTQKSYECSCAVSGNTVVLY